ncbi:MAG: DUF4173 domain-containing protein, partial [Blastocatellia bacterium]|nr:DUF4173 domain-containing protein [Blastocatellia bacterium]
MNKNTELGLTIILVALLLGILGDLLLRATPWGLNLTLWITLFISVLILLSRYRRVGLEGEGRWLLLPMLLFSFAFVWRDSLTLQFLDIMAIIICLALSTQYARDGMVRIASLTEYFIQMVMAAINSAFGFLLILVQDIEWKAIPKGKWMHHAISIFKGLLLATPLLIIFGLLFMAADAVFQGIVQKSLNISFEQLFLHGFIISFFTFVSAGLLRSALVGKRFTTSAPTQQVLSLGITEVATILFLVDMLFLGFVVVQIHYFFGGAAMVEQTTGLTYAEYARRGFFELVAVAALVLP